MCPTWRRSCDGAGWQGCEGGRQRRRRAVVGCGRACGCGVWGVGCGARAHLAASSTATVRVSASERKARRRHRLALTKRASTSALGARPGPCVRCHSAAPMRSKPSHVAAAGHCFSSGTPAMSRTSTRSGSSAVPREMMRVASLAFTTWPSIPSPTPPPSAEGGLPDGRYWRRTALSLATNRYMGCAVSYPLAHSASRLLPCWLNVDLSPTAPCSVPM